MNNSRPENQEGTYTHTLPLPLKQQQQIQESNTLLIENSQHQCLNSPNKTETSRMDLKRGPISCIQERNLNIKDRQYLG